METMKPDLCVIGAGPGGATAAAAAGALGAKVVLVASRERRRPGAAESSRALLAAAQKFGAAHDWTEVRDFLARIALEASGYPSIPRLRAMNVMIVPGRARFANQRAVEAGDVRIEARRFLLATGASPAVPRVAGLELVPWYTPASIPDLRVRPSHLVVLGGTAEALECAQAFRLLGARVDLVCSEPPLPAEDPELVAPILDQMIRQGIAVRVGAEVASVEPVGEGLRLAFANGETLDASHLLVAIGSQPNVEGIGLAAARVQFGADGVRVRPDMRTANSRIFAFGAVLGGAASAQMAAAQAGVAVRKALFRLPARHLPMLVPGAIFTTPGLASCGLTEAAARARGSKIQIFRASLADTGRARLEGGTRGHIKVVTATSGRILGAGIVGPEAAELIGPWQIALARRLSISDMASVAVPTATYSEASRQMAIAGLAARLRGPWVARLLKFARWLG